jgi:hypothetical protein
MRIALECEKDVSLNIVIDGTKIPIESGETITLSLRAGSVIRRS